MNTNLFEAVIEKLSDVDSRTAFNDAREFLCSRHVRETFDMFDVDDLLFSLDSAGSVDHAIHELEAEYGDKQSIDTPQ